MWLTYRNCSVFMSGSCGKDYDTGDEFSCRNIYCYLIDNYKLQLTVPISSLVLGQRNHFAECLRTTHATADPLD